jgi:hypothetical protein
MTRTHRLALVWALALLVALAPWHMAPVPAWNMAHADDGGGYSIPQRCPYDGFEQSDMAGSYESSYFLVAVYPCGGAMVYWKNDYGLHNATYYSAERLPGNGVIFVITRDQPYGLDGRQSLWVKPAEPGYVQMFTVNPDGSDLRVYRLRKTA